MALREESERMKRIAGKIPSQAARKDMVELLDAARQQLETACFLYIGAHGPEEDELTPGECLTWGALVYLYRRILALESVELQGSGGQSALGLESSSREQRI